MHSIKGTKASDVDTVGPVYEAPPNTFIIAVRQSKPYGPIAFIETVKLTPNLLNSDGYFLKNGDTKAGQLCEFRDSIMIPQNKALLTKPVTVLASGYCHAPGWQEEGTSDAKVSTETIFTYE